MTSRAVRSAVGIVALGMVATWAAPAAVGATGTTEPPAGCAEVGALLDSRTTLATALISGDAALMESTLADLSSGASAAADAAPAEIDAEIDTLAATVAATVTALEGVDLADTDAVLAALEPTEDEATAEAFPAVLQWAVDNCGYVEVDPFADAPEPPDCETLDAAAAAEAAGIEVDVTDLDGSADVSLPGFWTKSCSYGNGAMSISTLSFASLEDAEQFYADNLDVAGGVVLEVDIGALPESTLVIQTGLPVEGGSTVPSSAEPSATAPPSVQVAVFEAPIPFSVSFTGEDVDPADVVAAAEALLAAPPSGGEPPPSVVTTTA